MQSVQQAKKTEGGRERESQRERVRERDRERERESEREIDRERECVCACLCFMSLRTLVHRCVEGTVDQRRWLIHRQVVMFAACVRIGRFWDLVQIFLMTLTCDSLYLSHVLSCRVTFALSSSLYWAL